MRWFSILFVLSVGCSLEPKATRKPPLTPTRPVIVSPQKEVPVPTPAPLESPNLTMTGSSSVVAALHQWMGDGNTVTLRDPMSIKRPEVSLTLPAGTSLSYRLSEGGGSFTFNDPKPKVEARAFGFRVTPTLTRIDLKADDTGEATATLGPITRKQAFELKWSSPIVKAEIGEDTRPELWAYSTTGCTPCIRAKKELSEAKDLPFKVVWDPPNKLVPAWVESYPAFHWNAVGSEPEDKAGKEWRLKGWSGLSHLLKEFKRTRGTNATASLSPGIMFGQVWVEMSKGYTSVRHLIDEHGLTMEQLLPYLNDREALNRIHGWKHTGQGTAQR